MKRSTAALAVLGIFLIGAIAGALGAHLFYLRHLREPGGMARWGARLLADDLKRDLELTPQQARQVDAILLETRQETMAIRKKILPESIAALKRSRQRIEAVLDPGQQAKFKKMQEQRFKRFRHWMGAPDGPRDRGSDSRSGAPHHHDDQHSSDSAGTKDR